ncbi:MAG: hypothetical protein CMJ27_14615 [Phycisphaerae bacterium]|nr:hypothetical protein [Phycisphaerae bacterium]OUW99660.1 MAG: hypothetical protein CBD91_08520 [Phycisphaeraceae bacterium TMED231]
MNGSTVPRVADRSRPASIGGVGDHRHGIPSRRTSRRDRRLTDRRSIRIEEELGHLEAVVEFVAGFSLVRSGSVSRWP